MKKLTSLIFATVSALSLWGCGADAPTQAEQVAQGQNSNLISGGLKPEVELPSPRKEDQILSPTTHQMRDMQLAQGLPQRATSVEINPNTGYKSMAQAAQAGEQGVTLSTQVKKSNTLANENKATATETAWYQKIGLIPMMGLGSLVILAIAGLIHRKRKQ